MLNVFAPLNNLGYGVHSCNTIKALRKNGVDLALSPVGQTDASPYYLEYLDEGRIDKSNPSLHIFHDEYLHQVCGTHVTAFSVFETTKITDKALWNLNHNADKVFTTTAEHKEILLDNGVTTPVYVVPEGIDPELYNTEGEKYIDTGKPTYITVGKCEERKNTDMIIFSFIQAMQYKECALIAHTHNMFQKRFMCNHDYGHFKKLGFTMTSNDRYVKFTNGVCDIYFTKPIDDIKKMRSLYLSAHVGIAYSRAEGWDLPLIEMLACGIPTIVSNVIGHKEYLPGSPKVQQDLIVEPIGKELAQDGIWFHGNKGEWYTMSPEDLMEKLEDTYDEIDVYAVPNQELSKFYHDNYSWDKSALKIKELLEL